LLAVHLNRSRLRLVQRQIGLAPELADSLSPTQHVSSGLNAPVRYGLLAPDMTRVLIAHAGPPQAPDGTAYDHKRQRPSTKDLLKCSQFWFADC
jgi:hypothetical protein